VVAHLDTAHLEQAGPDRVRISGVAGSAPPPTTKVAITGLGGWRNSTTFVLTGLDADAKAALVETAVRARLDGDPGITDLRFTRVGVPAADPADQMAGSSLLHISVDGDQASAGRPFSSLCVELALSSYPGIYGTGVPGPGAPYGVYWPTLVPQRLLDHTVVHPGGRREAVPPPPADGPAESTASAGAGPHDSGPAVASGRSYDSGPTVNGPLGRLVHARSGDKGGNANVGLWVTDPAAWPWLTATMTTRKLRELLPETAGLDIDRYELPNLRAVNFVVRGLLDGGATEARRFDKQAKALGEWLRARHVALPARLLTGGAPSPGITGGFR
jgi:hypothetical protein